MDDTPVVELRAVRRAFGQHLALDNLTFAAFPGTVTVLLGPNGAGKTTAVRMITGALRADAGEVRTFGVDPGADGASVRGRCGVVSAKPALYDRLSGWDNLVYAAELYGLGGRAPIEESAARFGIEDALGLRVGGYSTGMKTRLALARAVLHNPDLLLLDEPTSGLDPESSRAVLHMIDELAAQGRTVIMCTHLLLEAEGLADQVVMLDEGRALVAGRPDDLVRQVWPRPWLVIDAEDRTALRGLQALPGVMAIETSRDGAWRVELDDLARVPDLVSELAVHGVRLTRVTPHEPSLEELYFALRGTGSPGGDSEPLMPRVRVA